MTKLTLLLSYLALLLIFVVFDSYYLFSGKPMPDWFGIASIILVVFILGRWGFLLIKKFTKPKE